MEYERLQSSLYATRPAQIGGDACKRTRTKRPRDRFTNVVAKCVCVFGPD